MVPQRTQVDSGGRQQWLGDDQRGIEQVHRLVRGQGQYPVAAQSRPAGVVQSAGHVAGLVPQAPPQRDRRQPQRPAMLGQPVQEGVRRRVIGLPGGPHQPGHGRKHHERRQIQVVGQLVQIPRRVHLRAQHRVDALGGQRRHHRVVEHPGGVDDGRQRMVRGDVGDDRGQCLPVGRVTGQHLHLRAGRGQFGDQFRGTRGVRAAPAQQHQVAHTVAGHRVARQYRTRHAGATGDQDRARGPGVGHHHHDLADVTGLAQVP